jgi:hypothetical protein
MTPFWDNVKKLLFSLNNKYVFLYFTPLLRDMYMYEIKFKITSFAHKNRSSVAQKTEREMNWVKIKSMHKIIFYWFLYTMLPLF